MIEISISKIKGSLSKYVNRTARTRERIIILSRGKPKAAVVSLEDLERLEELEDALAAAEALDAYGAGETVPWEQVLAELTEARNGLSD
jgi:prevent-host-death family protein